jgi:trehalose 6-phosphate phosphatase
VADDEPMILPPPPPELLDGAALFLDFDGTLVPLTDVPEAVRVDAELHDLLARTRDALHGRLAIVSGRSVATLRDTFGLGDFLLSGTHGLEFARPGEPAASPARLAAVDEAEQVFLAFIEDKPGLLVERKTLSVGLHFRRAPEWESACRALALEIAARTGLAVQPGKMLFELRPGGADKGSAVHQFMTNPLMAGSKPIFMGDDVTDEEGFLAAREQGGCGILVGPARVTLAQWHLEQVGAVRHYLSQCSVRQF